MKRATTHPRRGAARPERSISAASVRSYEKALREAGVTEKDLELLRDLAQANAAELNGWSHELRPTRVVL